jgi:hypothetical protein
VFAALAVSREAQARAGLSINKILKTLQPLRSATITIGAQQVTAKPRQGPNPPQRPRLEWSPTAATQAGLCARARKGYI